MKPVRSVLATALALVLAGCVPSVPARVDVPAITLPAPTPQPTDLVEARKAAGIADCPRSSDAPAVPGGMPEVTLECLGGDTTLRLAGLRGPLLVNLWAQWCEPCRSESAHLSAFSSTQKEVAVLGIDYSDPSPALAIEFAQLTNMTYPHLYDEEHQLKAPLGITGIPYTLLIDRNGKIIARHPGQFISLENVQEWVAVGLAG